MRRERTYVRPPSVRTDTSNPDAAGPDCCADSFGHRSGSLDQS